VRSTTNIHKTKKDLRIIKLPQQAVEYLTQEEIKLPLKPPPYHSPSFFINSLHIKSRAFQKKISTDERKITKRTIHNINQKKEYYKHSEKGTHVTTILI